MHRLTLELLQNSPDIVGQRHRAAAYNSAVTVKGVRTFSELYAGYIGLLLAEEVLEKSGSVSERNGQDSRALRVQSSQMPCFGFCAVKIRKNPPDLYYDVRRRVPRRFQNIYESAGLQRLSLADFSILSKTSS